MEQKPMTNAYNVSAAATAGQVRSSSVQGIGWIVLDNPGKHNAITLGMWRSLIDVLDGFQANPAIHCVVIRGEGERAFCAGADIGEKHDVGPAQALADLDLGLAGLNAVRSFGKPLIAMVSGYCIGAGFGIANACDLRIASSNASFAIPPAKLGIGYPYAEIKRLTELVGPAAAKQLVFTGDRTNAERAQLIGLVNEVVAPDELLQFTTSMALRIAGNAPMTVTGAKSAIATVLSDPPSRDIAACDERARACLTSEDYAEGCLAFKEKRPPVFRGR
jgi:enoyl-CoA hydratase/carnithine racemase